MRLIDADRAREAAMIDLVVHYIGRQPTVDAVPVVRWTSVSDRLPEPETNVIAFVGDYIEILSYRYDRRGKLAFMYMDDSGYWHERIRPGVTHWMPLPTPPKEVE